MPEFYNVRQVKDYINSLDPDVCFIRPHYSASYQWEVYHPESFGRGTYGFRNPLNLIDWANKAFN